MASLDVCLAGKIMRMNITLVWFTFSIVIVPLIGMIVFAFFALRYRLPWTQPVLVAFGVVVTVLGFGLIASPYLALESEQHDSVHERVPQPLAVAAIEYRLEEYWGLGFMPGDNETGFVVYQLTDESAEWARQQGSRLGDMLEGTQGLWNPTPIDDSSNDHAVRQWHPYDHDPQMMSESRPRGHSPTIREYLEKYGFTIPIEEGKDDEANRSLQSVGSFYAYGKGGSVTIVDPARGKVYFAYAG
jgi:hypothetical protein